MLPKTCWASNKICNKNHLLHLVGNLFPHINDAAWSKSLQICKIYCLTTRLNKIVVTLQDISLRLLVSENSKYSGVPYATLSTHSYSSGMRTDCTCTVVHLFRCSFPPPPPLSLFHPLHSTLLKYCMNPMSANCKRHPHIGLFSYVALRWFEILLHNGGAGGLVYNFYPETGYVVRFLCAFLQTLSNCQDTNFNFECCPRCTVWTLKSSHAEELGAQHRREGI